MLQARWKRRQAGEVSVSRCHCLSRWRSSSRVPQPNPDMVDRIMDAIEPGEWGPAAERQLCYEIKARPARPVVREASHSPFQTFVLAGHETSAAMLTWAVYELSRNPVSPPTRHSPALRREISRAQETDAKVLSEAQRVFSDASLPTRAAVESMDYTLGSLKEALRLYSVVPVVTRVAVVRS